MSYVFMDESWCLWFNFKKVKTSKYFVITFLFVENKRSLEKVIKKVFKTLSKSEIKRHSWELHCYKEHPKIKTKLFTLLKEKEVSIMSIYLNKKKVYTRLQDEKHVLYNYVTNILLDRIITKKLLKNKEITLIASRRETNKFLNENFKNYLKNSNWNKWLDIKVEIKTSTEEKCLQVVDACSWAIFRKYEHDCEEYYNIFREKIIEENPLF